MSAVLDPVQSARVLPLQTPAAAERGTCVPRIGQQCDAAGANDHGGVVHDLDGKRPDGRVGRLLERGSTGAGHAASLTMIVETSAQQRPAVAKAPARLGRRQPLSEVHLLSGDSSRSYCWRQVWPQGW